MDDEAWKSGKSSARSGEGCMKKRLAVVTP